MYRIKFVISLILSLLVCSSIVSGQTKSVFPIVAWGSVPQNFTNQEQYGNMREAGISYSFSHFTNLNPAIKALDMAAKYNVKILLYCPELFSQTAQTVKTVKDHPGLGGYLLSDEPNVERFERVLSWVNTIKKIDDKNICYINLYPIYASQKQLGGVNYNEYLSRFYSKFNLRIYSFDHYPVTNSRVRNDWYENLEMFSDMSRKKGSQFWGFVKVMSVDKKSDNIKMEDLKLQTFANLAYGAQGIQFYRYWSLEGKNTDAPISNSGRKNANFSKIKQVSQYITNLQSIFMNCSVESVYHSEVTRGTKRLAVRNKLPYKLLNAKNILISHIRNGDNRYVVFVNKSLTAKSTFKIIPSSNVQMIDKDRKQSDVMRGVNFTASVLPGDILIMKY